MLELACGPGRWTSRLLQDATSVTAVDAAPEMLAIARDAIGEDARVSFCSPTCSPGGRTGAMTRVLRVLALARAARALRRVWTLVDECLAPAGRVFFADDAYRTADELIEGPDSTTILRRLNDGSPHRVVKVPHTPHELERRLARLGWDIAVSPTAGPFYWGAGSRAGPS